MCTGQIKGNCKKVYANCTAFEGTIPEYSDLAEQDCLTIEETTQDIYEILTDIKTDLELESLRGECITYPVGEIKILDALTALQTFICQQQETINSQQTAITTLQAQVADLQTNTCP